MHLRSEAILLAIRPHGENDAVVRAFTPVEGVQAGYVRGARSRRLRPVLQPANLVLGEWRARTEGQLAHLTVELIHSLGPLHAEPLAAAALEWVTALTAAALPEAQGYPKVHEALTGVIGAIEASPNARGWASALARYELLLLSELGFGLDLEQCAATGNRDDLVFVSPKSGGAVSRAAAVGYEARLLRLPFFLTGGVVGGWDDIFDGLRLTGHFLERDLLTERRADTLAARERLVDRLKRAVA